MSGPTNAAVAGCIPARKDPCAHDTFTPSCRVRPWGEGRNRWSFADVPREGDAMVTTAGSAGTITGVHSTPEALERGVPWTIWCMISGLVSGTIGGQWDISWHMSIGRDTFWTPAHILIQLAAVLVGIACGAMILTATFRGESTSHSA